MVCRECLAFRGHKECREEMELKDRLVTRDRKECWDKRERKEMKGLVERAGRQEDGNRRSAWNCGRSRKKKAIRERKEKA